jgi:hypothetical protein
MRVKLLLYPLLLLLLVEAVPATVGTVIVLREVFMRGGTYAYADRDKAVMSCVHVNASACASRTAWHQRNYRSNSGSWEIEPHLSPAMNSISLPSYEKEFGGRKIRWGLSH